MIIKKANAKINLALEVMDEENGYHKVNNLMIPIGIYDEITLEKADTISIKDDPFPGENIMEKAARVFFDYTKINGGVYITIKKNIPHAAGLAGGSTDAASVLTGLNELYNAKLSEDTLIALSAKLGSDVGFFITNTPALCTGRGEIVNPLGFTSSGIRLFLIKPDTGLSTALVYKNYIYEGKNRVLAIQNIIEALRTMNMELLVANVFNDLEPVGLKLNEKMNSIYLKLKELGLHPFVSGSGPTMFLLNPTDEEIIKATSILDETTFKKEIYSI